MMVRVSVVVPTYRRPNLLSRCLAALVAQDLEQSDYEIIVVDDASDDETRQVVEGWATQARPRIRYVRTPANRGPAAARNAGWRAAEGEIIAFTDDDCVPAPNWLMAGADSLVNGAVGAWGHTLVPIPPVPTDYERDASHLSGSECATANCFFRRAAIEEVGGFDERFTTAWREDSDLHYRMEKLGTLLRVPEARVTHPVRPAPWGISLRQQRKSMFNALLYKKHPELYRRRIQSAPPLHYYGIVGAIWATVGLIARGRRRAALAPASVWAILTGGFCAHRLRDTSRAPTHVAEMVVTSILIPPLAVCWRIWGALKFRVFFL